MISLAETIVSLTDLTAGAAAMTVSESSTGVDEREIIVNETGLIALKVQRPLTDSTGATMANQFSADSRIRSDRR